MKIVVTGSLGNIGKPLAEELVQKGHSVTVISRKAERTKEIEALGAKAAIGSMEDADFLSATFRGADVVYVMETLDRSRFSDKNLDVLTVINNIGNNYKQAIERAGVKRIVHLSGIGANLDKGTGNLAMHHNAENILKQLPNDVFIKFMRPAGFYTNLFGFIQTIKMQGTIISNYSGNKKEPWVSPLDIAAAIAEEMEKSFEGRTVRYIASEEVSPNEIAKTLGAAIGKPDLQWAVISDEELQNSMLSIGMSPQVARGFVEMQATQRSGRLYEDYYHHWPVLGKVKRAVFAKDFAQVYHQQAK